MDFNPLNTIKSLGSDLVAAPKRLAHMVTHPGDAVKELPGFAKDVFMSPLNPASYPVRGAKAALGLLPDQIKIAPKMPAYTKLPPEALAQAVARSGKDLTYPMPSIRGNQGSLNEPVCMTVSGTKEELTKAFEKAGWAKAEKSSIMSTIKKDAAEVVKLLGLPKIGIDYNPQGTEISDAYLRGKPQVMAFNKNNDHHLVRDHFRVYDTGKKNAEGKPIWEIAATRDDSTLLNPKTGGQGHSIDKQVDKERDMVMADLLKTGLVKDWKVAKGVAPAADKRAQDQKFEMDGKVYMVDLG